MEGDVASERLVEAVGDGDEAGVTEALARGADPDAKADRFRSALAAAASGGHVGIARRLLEAGAHVGGVVVSPLRGAVMESRFAVVPLLLEHGALAAEPPERCVLAEAIGRTVHHPSPAALRTLAALLDGGATTTGGEGPLVRAVSKSAPPAVLRVLLDRGADPDERRSDGAPAVVVAARRDDHAAVDALHLAGADLEATDARGRTALMHAVERNGERTVATLLLAGADPATASPDGTTASRIARGWGWRNVRFTLGEHTVGREIEPVDRTTVRLRTTGVAVEGDQATLGVLAEVIAIALDDLGDAEWQTRTGLSADAAKAFAHRLRTDAVPAAGASWSELAATRNEWDTARAALVELAYGTTRRMPEGWTRIDVEDLLRDLGRQVHR